MKVAVFGSTGYGGQVLLRLLVNHPAVERIWAVSSSRQSTPIAECDGGLGKDHQKKLANGNLYSPPGDALQARPDAVFLALPHGNSIRTAESLLGQSVVFDLSADLRLSDARLHKEYYGTAPPLPQWRSRAVYGLPELYREPLETADLVAMPGCYPTSILLPLIPLARAGLLDSATNSASRNGNAALGGQNTPSPSDCIVINSLSGISGAGRAARINSLYVERAENTAAYSPGQTHRHYPEIAQELSKAGCQCPILFNPHLVPMRRGLFSTINILADALPDATRASATSPPDQRTTTQTSAHPPDSHQAISQILESAYSRETFVRLLPEGLPCTGNVLGSNRCDIGWTTTELPDGRLAITICSAIDNLMKGASGQAVQAMNIRFGLPENSGLSLDAHA